MVEISKEGVVFCGTLLCCLWYQGAPCDGCPLINVIRYYNSVEKV